MSWPESVAGMRATLLETFGDVATTYRSRQDGITRAIPSIYMNAHQRIDFGDGVNYTSSGPAVFAQISDLPMDPADDQPLIGREGVLYRVIETIKIGYGGVVFRIQRTDQRQ